MKTKRVCGQMSGLYRNEKMGEEAHELEKFRVRGGKFRVMS